MNFKTPQGQAAYQEMMGELPHAIQFMLDEASRLADRHPSEAVGILINTHARVAEMRVDGIAKAIQVGTAVDTNWVELAARLTMEMDNWE